jgi:hypothetical protein
MLAYRAAGLRPFNASRIISRACLPLASKLCRRPLPPPRPKPRASPRLPQSRRVHRLRQHSRRTLQPLLLRLRFHLHRKRPSQTPQLRRRRARLSQSPLLRQRLQQRPRKSRERQPIPPRRNLPHTQRLRRRRKHRQRRKSQILAPPRSSRLLHPRPRRRQPLSASSHRAKRSCWRGPATTISAPIARTWT